VEAAEVVTVGIYNLYWSTYGGGEQVSAAIAEHLVATGHRVVLLGPGPVDDQVMLDRLGRDLSGCEYRRVNDDDEASSASADVDVFVNGTYLSRAENRAPVGLYYVHFPGVPPTTRQRRVDLVARIGLGVLERPGHLPGALLGVRDGLRRRRIDHRWTSSYDRFLANSAFTAQWVTRLWEVPSEVLHPPVQPSATITTGEPRVLSIGRFFDPSFGHCKKQDVLLDVWETMERSTVADGWSLEMIGGADAASREYVLGLRRRAVGRRVDIAVNARREVLGRALSSSALLWHAAGFGEDPDTHPDRFEHFGIAVVEAMSAGVVPLVHAVAGPAEIVRDGVDGRWWRTREELSEITGELMVDGAARSELSRAAVARAASYSTAAFNTALDAVLASVTSV
jgi:glycosyltransferase involved in cell wall biosynthesis